MPTEALQVTPASAWREVKEQGFPLQLPSGHVARLKRTLSLITLMQNGQIPNPISKRVEKLMNGELKVIDPQTLDEEELAQMMELINSEIPHIFVDPKVYPVPQGENPMTWTPDDPNGISLSDVSMQDRSFAYSFAQGGPATLDKFSKFLEDVQVVSNVEAVQLPSESDTGD